MSRTDVHIRRWWVGAGGGSAVSAVTGALAISACGSDTKDDANPSTTPASAASSVDKESAGGGVAESAPAAGAAESKDCGAAEGEVRAGLAASGSVTDVKVIGQCTMVSVSTSLEADAAGALAARALCEIAAAQAYPKGVSSVSIDAKDGTELAVGIKDASCIAQPR